jgi:hypothetical protein
MELLVSKSVKWCMAHFLETTGVFARIFTAITLNWMRGSPELRTKKLGWLVEQLV